MNSNQKSEIKHNLRRRAERLVEELDLDAPNVILGNSLYLILQAGIVLCGKEFYERVADEQIKNARVSYGFCPTCDSSISNEQTFRPVCEHCEEKQEKFSEEMDKYLIDFDEDLEDK